MIYFETSVSWSYNLFSLWNEVGQGTSLPTAHISTKAERKNVYDLDSIYTLMSLVRDIYMYRSGMWYKQTLVNLKNKSFYIEVEIDQSGVVVYLDSTQSKFGVKTSQPEAPEWQTVTMNLLVAMKTNCRYPEICQYKEFLEKYKVSWFNPNNKLVTT